MIDSKTLLTERAVASSADPARYGLRSGFTPGQVNTMPIFQRRRLRAYNGADSEVENVELTAVYIQVPEGFIGFVEELPGANTQGATLEEARENLQEAVTLVVEANRQLVEESLRGQDVIREPLTLSAA
jgi:predicted RNase H-like HicB family nuclease